jgi:lipoprotein-releasing system permease protein
MLARLYFRNYLMSTRSGALVRRIAWLSMIGTGLGVTALVIVLSVMSGFNRTIRARMFLVEPQVVVPLPKGATWGQMKLPERFNDRHVENIEEIYPYESRDLIVRSADGAFAGSIAKGYPASAIDKMLKRVWKMNKKDVGDWHLAASDLGPHDIILGGDLARSLGVYEGDEVILIPPENLLLPKGEMPKFEKYTIRAVVATQLPEVDGQLLMYALGKDSPKELVSGERGFEIRLKDPYAYERVMDHLRAMHVKAQDWTERNTSLFFALRMEKFAMTLFLSLAVLITSFSIVTAMVLVISQKRRDIGMMMAMGLSQKLTKRIFLNVGLMLGGCGIGSGLLVGLVASVVMHVYPLEVLPDIYQDTTLPVDPSWQIAVSVLIGSSLLAIMGAWLPVLRFKDLSPSVNLKS